MSEKDIRDEIKLLEDNIFSKKWVMNHPSYPLSYQEKCVAEDRILEMEERIEELKKQLSKYKYEF